MQNAIHLSSEQWVLEQLRALADSPRFLFGDVQERFERLKNFLSKNPAIELAFVTNARGVQSVPTVAGPKSKTTLEEDGMGKDRSDRAWFHITSRQKKPYIGKKMLSLSTNRLSVTVAVPLFDSRGALHGVVSVEIPVHPSTESPPSHD